MANNHGGSGSKFVSVNLNKSYGQPSHHNNPPHSGSYGPGVGTNRARPGGHTSAGGGMVVLSRNRPLQKSAPKLSVPPPLNLPSLRKEYEKTDSSGSGGGAAGGGSGSGSRPSSSGMGWTKPGNVALQEKEFSTDTQVSESVNYNEGVAVKNSGTYMPPSARFGGGFAHGDTGPTHYSHAASVEKAMVLRGEDFPSLRAALPSSNGPAQKQREAPPQKLKQLVSDESSKDLRNSNQSTQIQRVTNGVNENIGLTQRSVNTRANHAQKQDDPLPLVWLNPRSDWADDERDTGHGFIGRSNSNRDHELPKSDPYWDRDFDVPRNSILPHKPPNNLSERRLQPIAKGPTSEVSRTDPYRREMNLHNIEDRENNLWRNSSVKKDRFTASQVMNDGNNVTVPDSFNHHNANHGLVTGNRDTPYVRRDTGQVRQTGQRNWNHSAESPRYRNENYQNSSGAKSVFSQLSVNDPVLNFGRQKPKNERVYDDSYQKDFGSNYDERDPFTGNLVGVVKRKKEAVNQTDFHDPVRESFEAELERVQKMQEMERQRVVEEQERALEQARREDEERQRIILEEKERIRRMEEEAREASWRAEQERLEAAKKAEELKIAREEEKKRMILEEERRKQAAKQKLLELEAKIAKRDAEIGKTDEIQKDSDASMDSDLDNWEVSQRMVERITTSASSDSSAIDRPQFSSNFVDRSKPVNPWKRDAFEVGSNSSFLINDQENGHHSPKTQIGGRSFPRKDFYGGFNNNNNSNDGFPHLGENRDQRWNSFGDGEQPYGRNREIESEFYENVGDWGQGQGHSRNNARSPYSDQLYMNSYGRSRYAMKQPRVLPPPSLSSVPKSSVRGENELSNPSSSLESTARTGNYGGQQDKLEQTDLQQEIMAQNLDKNETIRCDSQSSLSVSSPPSSPTHLSHDELDDSAVEEKNNLEDEVVNDETVIAGSKSVTVSVDEDEDEEWSIENQQEQEEYDEDDGYGEEDEVHDENINLTNEFENMNLDEKNTTDVIENLVLGFNEGVEVGIPADEFDNNLKTDSNTVDKPPVSVSVSVVEKQAPVDTVIHEQTSATVEIASNSCSGQSATITSTTPVSSSFQNQTDSPVKLQFGLFSGPSLIPSPVPAIQIGSIQMPLAPIGSSMAHVHPSQQPPLFQFGQLRYTPPVSQGILPQPISLVHPAHFNLPQNSVNSQFAQQNSVNLLTNQSGNVSTIPNLTHENWNDNRIPVAQTEEKGDDTSSRVGKKGPISKAPGPSSANRGKRNTYPARNSGPRTFQAYDQSGPNEFRKHRRPIQRTEFRVRENANNNNNKNTGNNASGYNYRRHVGPATSMRHEASDSQEIVKETGRLTATKTQTATSASSVEGNLKRNVPEEDVDAPMQSGVVRVFQQLGIECPSDEDDFIEVRSKRQMLNDRREQREKEIKAKSRATKQPRKARSSIQSNATFSGSSKLVGESSNNIRGLVNKEPLAPIGTPTVESDAQRSNTTKCVERGSGSAEDNDMFESENKVVDNVQTSLGDWGNARMEQQVIPLTQTQLDEAMKPARSTHVTSIGDHTTSVNEPILPSSLIKGKSISSPINSLLAGEKIQFGAVTSPTILAPSSRVVSHGIGAPGSFRPEVTQISSKIENDNNIFFKKDEKSTQEVEAVAVAAIDTDEITGNVSVSGTTVDPIQGGLTGDQQLGSQTKPEESLSVSLPADLSVETPPISLWPPLPSPQGSSTQMLSHFHSAAPSHFPFYEMNHPMMSGPVFAFGPHDESGGSQPQSQKPTGSGTRHMGPWQNHSGMDSFYGPPAGFTGPFIGSPGVQAPPHMVVYNHYAPVGQFGQVGLSFMGATYIPSGKQPDWKHDPASSSRGEEEMNMRNPPNIQPPIQHLAPGSPLLPMGSPLTMFDHVPPFQTAADMSSVQPRWSHMPAPMSLPLQQQQAEFSSHVVDQSTYPPNRYSEAQASAPSNSNGLVFPVSTVTTHFPDELGLVGPSISASSAPAHIPTKSNNNGGNSTVEFKNQHQQQGNNNNNHGGGGYGYSQSQKGGGVSPKNRSMGQWAHPHRRSGFHGRYQNEKNFAGPTKIKQIYVAKQPGGGPSSTVG